MTEILGRQGLRRAGRMHRARSALVYGAMMSSAAIAAALASGEASSGMADTDLRFLRSGGFLYVHPDPSSPDFALHWKVGPDGRKQFVARIGPTGNPAAARFSGVSHAFARPAS